METTRLTDILDPETHQNLHRWLDELPWHHNVPGGFVTNKPKRLVNAFGNGAAISDEGKLLDSGWDRSYWTAKINQNNTTLETPTTPIPEPLRKIIPAVRRLFRQVYPQANITDNTFTIAVCNYYTSPEMTIAAHTDDNPWYPREIEGAPVFASFTFYPQGEPERDEHFARFQIKREGKWIPVKLPHDTVTIMPSNIEHRVQAYTKKMTPYFRPRINITLRSTYPLSKNPLQNALATCNHSRYYRLPRCFIFPSDLTEERLKPIYQAYLQCSPDIAITRDQPSKSRSQRRHQLLVNYRTLSVERDWMDFRCSPNITLELVQMVLERLEKENNRTIALQKDKDKDNAVGIVGNLE